MFDIKINQVIKSNIQINKVINSIKLINQKPYAGAFEGRTEVPQRKIATPFTHQTENLDMRLQLYLQLQVIA